MEVLRKKIDYSHPTASVVKWCKDIPIKVSCFSWRAAQDRIPTAKALSHRGIKLNSRMCSSCIGQEEDANHLLLHCPYASKVRDLICDWCETSLPLLSNLKDFLLLLTNWGSNQKRRKRFMIICYALLWGLWKFRNDRLFRDYFISPSSGADYVKSIAYTWIKYRGNGVICNLGEVDYFSFFVFVICLRTLFPVCVFLALALLLAKRGSFYYMDVSKKI